MKLIRAILLTISIFIIAPSVYGQFRSVPPDNSACGTPPPPDNYKEVLLPNKSYRNFISEEDSIIVPVVFHIYHTGTPVGELYNVSDETLFLAVHRLNEAFSHTGIYDTTEFSTPENLPAADTRIRFALAKRDPDGNPTDGINRIDVSEITPLYAGNGVLNTIALPCGGLDPCPIYENNLFSNSVWDQDPPEVIDGNGNDGYLNIFIVNGINGNVGASGGIQGYSKVPISNSGESTSTGVVVRSSRLTGMMNTLAHEVGHWLGLYHTFGQTNYMPFCPTQSNCLTELDKVCDTAPDYDGNGCSSPCYGANVRNIMSYHSCKSMFTQGQSDRIWTHGIDYAYPWLLNTVNWLPFNDYDLRITVEAIQDQCTDSFTDKIKVDNLGSLSVTGFTVMVTGPSGIAYEQYFDQAILSGDNIYIEFENSLITGNNTFTYEVIAAVDEYLDNNTTTRTVIRDNSLEQFNATIAWDTFSDFIDEGILLTQTDPDGNCELCPVILGREGRVTESSIPGCTISEHSVCIQDNTCFTVNLNFRDTRSWYCTDSSEVDPEVTPWYTLSFKDEFISVPIPEAELEIGFDDAPLNINYTFCNGEFDPISVCIDEDNDNICDYEDSCVGEYDALNICNGTCSADEDSDGICDDIDPCIGIVDECGACNGPGAIFDCGCFTQDCEWCDCDGTKYDLTGTCGGDCLEDSNFNSICDRYEPCLGLTEPTYNGYTYGIVDIGQKCWFSENLKTTRFRNNQNISNIIDKESWKDLEEAGMCYYDNNESNGSTNGILYNWYAVNDSRGLCPSGWHVPTDEEWQDLERALGMNEDEILRMSFRSDELGIADKLKPGGISGFNSLNSGFRHSDSGKFKELDKSAYYWTSTSSNDIRNGRYSNAYHRIINDKSNGISRSTGTWSTSESKGHGLSVRCVND